MASMNLDFGTLDTGVNIKDVKVDPRLRVRIDTGLDFLNFVKSGEAAVQGLLPSEVILFTGTSGGGKSTLCLQLADSLSGMGHEVLVNSVEEAPAQVKMTYERLGLKNGFTICNSTFIMEPEGGNKELRDKVGNNTLLNHMKAMLKRHKAANVKKSKDKRKHMVVIVDSLQAMNDGKYGLASNNKTPIRVLEELCNFAKKHFVTIIVVGHVGKSGDFKGDNTILHMVDAHMHLWVDDDPKSDTEGLRLLECRKNRFGPTGITVHLDIAKNGLREHNVRGKLRGRRV